MDKTLLAMSDTAQAVDSGRSHVNAAGREINTVTAKLQSVTSRMAETASSVAEQSAAIDEISRVVTLIKEKTQRSHRNAELSLVFTQKSEEFLNSKLSEFQAMNIPDAVIDFAKSDHILWKKRLAGMFVGTTQLSASELASHRECRLGKWYYQIQDPTLLNHPSFQQMEEPHRAVHAHGKAAAELFARGRIASPLFRSINSSRRPPSGSWPCWTI